MEPYDFKEYLDSNITNSFLIRTNVNILFRKWKIIIFLSEYYNISLRKFIPLVKSF